MACRCVADHPQDKRSNHVFLDIPSDINAGITIELLMCRAGSTVYRAVHQTERDPDEMRRHLVSITVAVIAAASTLAVAAPTVGGETASSTPTVAVQRVSLPYPALRDEAAMVLVGTALIALAAAVRRVA
jgi:hypothetical protein